MVDNIHVISSITVWKSLLPAHNETILQTQSLKELSFLTWDIVKFPFLFLQVVRNLSLSRYLPLASDNVGASTLMPGVNIPTLPVGRTTFTGRIQSCIQTECLAKTDDFMTISWKVQYLRYTSGMLYWENNTYMYWVKEQLCIKLLAAEAACAASAYLSSVLL